MESRIRKESVVIDGMVEAIRNSLRGCMGIFEEMARCV
jgi:AMMECR1 domain-containing protein